MDKVYIYSHKLNEGITSEELTIACLKDYLNSLGYSESEEGDLQVHIMRDTLHGKPYFKEYPAIYHNVSHSGDWWVCAFGTEENGLDLQQAAHNNTMKIARRFFHPDETSWLSGRNLKDFFRVWAYKESYLKFTGDGLTNGMNYFSVLGSYFDPGEDYEKQLPGADGVRQLEIPFFQNGYWMVLTTRKPAQVVLKQL